MAAATGQRISTSLLCAAWSGIIVSAWTGSQTRGQEDNGKWRPGAIFIKIKTRDLFKSFTQYIHGWMSIYVHWPETEENLWEGAGNYLGNFLHKDVPWTPGPQRDGPVLEIFEDFWKFLESHFISGFHGSCYQKIHETPRLGWRWRWLNDLLFWDLDNENWTIWRNIKKIETNYGERMEGWDTQEQE